MRPCLDIEQENVTINLICLQFLTSKLGVSMCCKWQRKSMIAAQLTSPWRSSIVVQWIFHCEKRACSTTCATSQTTAVLGKRFPLQLMSAPAPHQVHHRLPLLVLLHLLFRHLHRHIYRLCPRLQITPSLLMCRLQVQLRPQLIMVPLRVLQTPQHWYKKGCFLAGFPNWCYFLFLGWSRKVDLDWDLKWWE